MSIPWRLVEKRYGTVALKKAYRIWEKVALPAADARKLEHLLSRRETSPQMPPCESHVEGAREHLFELVCKLLLYAPTLWYRAILGEECPRMVHDDAASQAVALDASNRLRRAGIEYFHDQLVNVTLGKPPLDRFSFPAVFHVSADGRRREITSFSKLPKPPTRSLLRVVAVSHTQLLHRNIRLPSGDVLVHVGGISFEEGRSLEAKQFEELGSSLEDGLQVLKWLRDEQLGLYDALLWLGEAPGFKHRLLLAGEDDWLLQKLGSRRAQALCRAFGVRYLEARSSEPVVLSTHLDTPVSVSVVPTALPEGREMLNPSPSRGSKKLPQQGCDSAVVDILVVPSPSIAAGPGAPERLLNETRPSLVISGERCDMSRTFSSRVADLRDGQTVGVNPCCASEWGHFYGLPVVTDIVPKGKESGTLAITVDGRISGEHSNAKLFVIGQLVGKPLSKFTMMLSRGPGARLTEREFPNYGSGDSLEFSLYAGDPAWWNPRRTKAKIVRRGPRPHGVGLCVYVPPCKSKPRADDDRPQPTFLGSLVLPHHQFSPQAFDGTVKLANCRETETGMEEGSLTLKVRIKQDLGEIPWSPNWDALTPPVEAVAPTVNSEEERSVVHRGVLTLVRDFDSTRGQQLEAQSCTLFQDRLQFFSGLGNKEGKWQGHTVFYLRDITVFEMEDDIFTFHRKRFPYSISLRSGNKSQREAWLGAFRQVLQEFDALEAKGANSQPNSPVTSPKARSPKLRI